MTKHNWVVIGLGALVEAVPAYLWYLLLHYRFGAAGPGLGLGTLFLSSLFASILAAWMEERTVSRRLWPWLAGFGGALAAAARLFLQPALWMGEPVLAPVALLWSWYRGLGLPWSGDDNGEALQRFRSAILGTALVAVTGAVLGVRGAFDAMQASALLAVGGLLLSGLLLLAVTHQAGVRKALAARGAGGAVGGRVWTAAAVVVALTLLGLAFEGSRLVLGGRLTSLLRLLAPAWDLAARLLEGSLMLAIRVLAPLVTALMWLLKRAIDVLFRLEHVVGQLGLSERGQQSIPLPGARGLDVRWQVLVALLVSALVAFLLIRRTVRRHWERTLVEGLVELHESVWPGLSPGNLLKALLGLFRRQAAEENGEAGDLAPARTRREEIRRLYRRYLAMGQEAGWPRWTAETPGRYQFRYLSRFTPPPANQDTAAQSAAAHLTRAYEATRYGEMEPAEAEVHAAAQDVSVLEEDLARALKQPDERFEGRSGMKIWRRDNNSVY